MTELEPTQQSKRSNWGRRIAAGFVVIVIIGLIVASYHFNWLGTGIPNKTIWDWMELLLVPGLLLLAGAWIQQAENRRQEQEKQREQARQAFEERETRRRDEERYREETVRKYFDDMAHLMVEKNLLELVQSVEPIHSSQAEIDTKTGEPILAPPSKPDPQKIEELLMNPVWIMAQTRTITVLRRMEFLPVDNREATETDLDVQRVNEILDFLRDSGLLADTGSILIYANLENINLKGVNLWLSNLSGSALYRADLSGAQLEKANLSGARLGLTNMSEANLREANLTQATLARANLFRANLDKSNLSGAKLFEVSLLGASLSEATLTNETTLPLPVFVDFDDEKMKPIFNYVYDPALGIKQMDRYTNPKHPEFVQPGWAMQKANNNDENT